MLCNIYMNGDDHGDFGTLKCFIIPVQKYDYINLNVRLLCDPTGQMKGRSLSTHVKFISTGKESVTCG